MKPTSKKPTDAQLKSAYQTWRRGGISIWGIKKQTGILAKVLLPAFEKLSGKKIKTPAAKLPKPTPAKGKGEKATTDGAKRKEADHARRAA